MDKKPVILRWILFVATLLAAFTVYQVHAPQDKTYLGFSRLSWNELGDCRIETSKSPEFGMLSRTVSWRADKAPHTANCRTNWFNLQGNQLELEFAGRGESTAPEAVAIEVELENYGTLETVFAPIGALKNGYRLAQVRIPPNSSSRVRIHLKDDSAAVG